MTNKNKQNSTVKVATPKETAKAKKTATKTVAKKTVTKIFDNKVVTKKPKVTATTKGLLESMQSELTKTFG